MVKIIETSTKLTQIKVPVFSEEAAHGNKILQAIVSNSDLLGRLQLFSVNEQGSWWKGEEYGEANLLALIELLSKSACLASLTLEYLQLTDDQ